MLRVAGSIPRGVRNEGCRFLVARGVDGVNRTRAQLLRDAYVRTVRLPVVVGKPGQRFDLAYVRQGPVSDRPSLVLPGAPVWRRSCLTGPSARRPRTGLDVVMVEHRGVGLSRIDDDERDLPPEALTVDQAVGDLAAVLDDCDASSAVVYGSSYGAYLAQGLGVRHPDRVAGMVLDSVILTVDDDLVVRQHLRDLYWHGTEPETTTAAALMRQAVASGVVTAASSGAVAQVVHEFAGPATLERLLRLRLASTSSRQCCGVPNGCASPLSADAPRSPDMTS